MNALLLLDKPQGLSSHSAVHRVRKLTGEERAGHAGTLDPMATGVLLILLGNAVRLSEYIIDHDKKYRATVKLGVEMDTYDATGTVVETRPVAVSPAEIENALASFVGKLNQVPPQHSAIQVQGKRAYKLARQGAFVQLEPRSVEIYSITNITTDADTISFDVHCSKGTYIRSIAHDLGAKLGTGGHLSALRRLAIAEFTIEQSVTLEQLEAAITAGTVAQHLLSMDFAISQFDQLTIDPTTVRAVQTGKFIDVSANLTTPLVRAYDDRGRLIALLEQVAGKQYKPKKVFEIAP